MIAVMAWHFGMSKATVFFYALMWLIIETQKVFLRIKDGFRSLRAGKPSPDCSSAGKEPGLPVIRFKKLQRREKVDETCSICLMEFEGEDEVSELGKCGHVFHENCIGKWAEKSRFTCPLCRAFFFDEETWQARWGLANNAPQDSSSSSLYYFLQ